METAVTELGEYVPALASRMVAASAHASDVSQQTGVLPVITADMLDPRTAALPADVVDEPAQSESPLHSETTGTIPAVPAQTRTESTPLPQREFVGGDAGSDDEGAKAGASK